MFRLKCIGLFLTLWLVISLSYHIKSNKLRIINRIKYITQQNSPCISSFRCLLPLLSTAADSNAIDNYAHEEYEKPLNYGPLEIKIRGKVLTPWAIISAIVITSFSLAVFPFVLLFSIIADLAGNGKVILYVLSWVNVSLFFIVHYLYYYFHYREGELLTG